MCFFGCDPFFLLLFLILLCLGNHVFFFFFLARCFPFSLGYGRRRIFFLPSAALRIGCVIVFFTLALNKQCGRKFQLRTSFFFFFSTYFFFVIVFYCVFFT